MTEPESVLDRDARVVRESLRSPEWQARLETARAQRLRVLASRERQARSWRDKTTGGEPAASPLIRNRIWMSAASLGVLALVLGSGVVILRSAPEPPTPQPRPITAQIEAPQFVSGVDLPASPKSVAAVETPVISVAPAPRLALQPADPAPRIDQTPLSLAGIREARLTRLAAAVPPGTRVNVPSGPDWVFNIPGLRIAASILAEPEEVVRYFHPEDRALAEAAAQAINARVDDFTFYAPAPPQGTVQVWLSDSG